MFEDNNQKRPLYIPYAGPALLETPLLNKGSAFTSEERSNFNALPRPSGPTVSSWRLATT